MDELELMEIEQQKEIASAIINNGLFDYITTYSYQINDDLLLDLLKECIATLEENQKDTLIENLKEYRDWKI